MAPRSHICLLGLFLVVCATVFSYSSLLSGVLPPAQAQQPAAPESKPVQPAEPVQPVPTLPPAGDLRPGSDDTFYASEAVPSPTVTSPDVYAADALAKTGPVAVIIEDDINVPNLIPVMLHFATVLGPDWKIILFTLEANYQEPESPAFRRALARRAFEVRFLPADTLLKDSSSVSRFLAKPWLWEQLEAAHRILMFQSDSILCSKSPTTVESFFEYDLVGAPIAARYGEGYNGGLSLRNPRLFLNITREEDFEQSGAQFEDQWFYRQARTRADREGSRVRLPAEDVAKTFAVETIDYDKPLGYHQPARWQGANMEAVEAWCPEVKLLIGRRAQ